MSSFGLYCDQSDNGHSSESLCQPQRIVGKYSVLLLHRDGCVLFDEKQEDAAWSAPPHAALKPSRSPNIYEQNVVRNSYG